MKTKYLMLFLASIIFISGCNINLNLPSIHKSENVIESASKYCEDFESCKVQVDSNVNVENYDIYNTYTEAYSKVKEVSVVVNGFNYKANNEEGYVVAGSYSGFIIDKEISDATNYKYTILTTGLKLDNLPYYEIMIFDGTRYEASRIGMFNDAYYHIGLFTFISNKDITLTNVIYDKELKVGEELLTISSPHLSSTIAHSMTKGIISGLNRQVEVENDIYAMGFQFDAPTNQGSQGGAIFDIEGNIYGMIAGKVITSASIYIESVSVGNNLKDIKYIIDTLLNGENYEKPLIGVQVIDYATLLLTGKNYYLYPLNSGIYNVDEVTEEQFTLKMELPKDVYTGIYISMISAGSVAANAGVTAGDIILKVDDVDVIDNVSLAMYLYQHKKGDTIRLYTYLNSDGYELRL